MLDDIAYFFFEKTIFDTEIAIQRGYQFGCIFLDEQTGFGRDLGFNYYNGDLAKPLAQAQQDKWDFMLEKLNLREGDRLIDIGCGYGDWLNYARSKGIEVIGVNISPDQAKVCEERYGIEVLVNNWKDIPATAELRARLYGKFDAVTFMDTVEHYVPSKYRNNLEKQGEIYTAMFAMAHELLKDTASPQRVFISCLHLKKGISNLKDYLPVYLQTRFHSGFYPVGDDGLMKWGDTYFTETERHDQTEDYRLTSVLDPKHFGSPDIQWTWKKAWAALGLFFLDPHHLHKWLEYRIDAWMWHFGSDAHNPEYNNTYQKPLRHINLWWLVLEKK